MVFELRSIIRYYYHAVCKVFKSPKRNSANLQDLKEVKLIPNFAIVSKIDLKHTPVLMSEHGVSLPVDASFRKVLYPLASIILC